MPHKHDINKLIQGWALVRGGILYEVGFLFNEVLFLSQTEVRPNRFWKINR